MNIVIDYDSAWRTDPALWESFTVQARVCGHQVYGVSGRWPGNEPPEKEFARFSTVLGASNVFLTGTTAKSAWLARNAKLRVDLWIDGIPLWIHQDRY